MKRGKSEEQSINVYTNFKAPLISDVGVVMICHPCCADLYTVDSNIREDFGEFKNMAFARNLAESRITELGLSVLSAMIVISKWADTNDDAEHVNQWLFDVQRTLIKPSGKRLKRKQYYKFLFAEQIHKAKDITQYINRELRGYRSLQEIGADAEVYVQLTKTFKQFAKDLSNNQFEVIQNYLQQYS